MSKFITPVAMTGTKEQLEPLFDKLRELGYNIFSREITNEFVSICTNFMGIHDRVSTQTREYMSIANRYAIDPFNEELFLALAAMKEGTHIYNGEYVIRVGISMSLEVGGIYKVIDATNQNDLQIEGKIGYSPYHAEFFRKATKEEIIAHFSSSTVVVPEFILPEKWAICVKLNKELIGSWFNENHTGIAGRYDYRNSYSPYLVYPRFNGTTHIQATVPTGYTEITLEQFKEYVLKQQSMKEVPVKERKILGYICPMNLFDNEILTGQLYCKIGYHYYPSGAKGKSCCYLPKEIVETWEPVYEPEETEITLANNVKVKVSKESVDIDGLKLSKEEFEKILNEMHKFQ